MSNNTVVGFNGCRIISIDQTVVFDFDEIIDNDILEEYDNMSLLLTKLRLESPSEMQPLCGKSYRIRIEEVDD